MTTTIRSFIDKLTLNKAINYLLVLFAFIFPISIKQSTVILILIILLWVIEGNWKEKFDILYRSKPFRYYFAFILFIGLSLLWSDTIYGGFVKRYPSNGIIAYIRMYFLGFMLVPIMLTSMKMQYAKWVISAFLSAMFISEMASWAVYMEWIHIRNVYAHDPSPFMHHSLYSIFLAITVFVLLTEFFRVKNIYVKAVIILFILSAMVNLFLNGGRLGQLAFFVALLVYIFMKFRITFKTISLSIVSVVVIFILAYNISPLFQLKADQSIHSLEKVSKGNFNSSWGKRIYALIVAKDIVLENPIIGVGIGSAKKEFIKKSKVYPHGGLVEPFWHMHNEYMQILVETGVMGLLLFFLFLYMLLKISLEKDIYILLCTFIVIYLVGFIGEPLFWNLQPYLLFNFFIGFFLWFGVNNTYKKGIEI